MKPARFIACKWAATVLAASVLITGFPGQAKAAKKEQVKLPVASRSGLDSSKLADLDRIMLKVMKSNDIYAGQLAVAKNGKLALL
jgi:hypothetical protein